MIFCRFIALWGAIYHCIWSHNNSDDNNNIVTQEWKSQNIFSFYQFCFTNVVINDHSGVCNRRKITISTRAQHRMKISCKKVKIYFQATKYLSWGGVTYVVSSELIFLIFNFFFFCNNVLNSTIWTSVCTNVISPKMRFVRIILGRLTRFDLM